MGMQAPDRKVTTGLLAGAVMTVVAWVTRAGFDLEIPADVALAGSTIILFALQYFVPNVDGGSPEDEAGA